MTVRRIAMWSGPRNISTALMRSFENRPDTVVCDEPFYACYLAATDWDHPGRDEIIAQGEVDATKVAEWLGGPLPNGADIWYQKHMSHHLLDDMPREWMLHPDLQHVFLIRSPREVIVSMAKVLPDICPEQTGLPGQIALFDWLTEKRGERPLVLDAQDVLRDPSRLLLRLCESIGIAYHPGMLDWPAGPRTSDGIWAKYWYANVERSTTFAPYRLRSEPVPEPYQLLWQACQPLYDHLVQYKID